MTLYKLSHSIIRAVTGILCIIILILFCESFAFASGSLPAAKEKNNHIADPVIEINDGLITINVLDMPVTTVLKELSQKSGIEILMDKGIEEKVTIRLENMPLEDVLKRLLDNRALVYEFDSDIGQYHIVRAGAFQKKGGRAGSEVKELKDIEEAGQHTAAGLGPVSLGQVSETAQERLFDSKGRPLYRQGELLIKFKDGADTKALQALHDRLGSTLLKRNEGLSLDRVKIKQGITEKEAIASYSSSDLVEIAERHALRYPDRIEPNDPFFAEQWNLTSIRAPEAWEFTRGKPEVIIAVIDSGVNYLHPDLEGSIWINPEEYAGAPGVDDDNNGYDDDIYGWDFADSDSDPMDVDIDSHGTHVAGIIGAVGNNGKGIAGIGWNIRIMPLKVQTDDGQDFPGDAIYAALKYAANNGAHIVNCSFGGGGYSETEEGYFRELEQKGLLAVCSAGNSGANNDVSPNYPASYNLSNIISVAASDQADNLAGFSNYGANTVHLMAPGVNIKSTGASTIANVFSDSGNMQANGMSYAGITNETGISGRLYNCGKGLIAEDFPAEVNGNIALIERGEIYFSDKTANAQASGAIAVIIYNYPETVIFWGTLGTTEDWVPVVSISGADGALLLQQESSHPIVTVINNPADYGYMGGTSVSAPHVSGAAGLIMSYRPGLSAVEVKSRIIDTVDKIGYVSSKLISGGRLNVYRALGAVDLNCNEIMGLEDAILGLQILSGNNFALCSDNILEFADSNDDGKIGMEEILYILDKISETE